MKALVCFAVYAAGFIGVYGHAFNSFASPIEGPQRATGAMLCAFAWPLYVSVEAWK